MTEEMPKTRGRWVLGFALLALGTGSFVYRVLVDKKWEQTALMFVGLPTILAFVIAVALPTRSAMGMTMKAVTLFLLASAMLLGEGVVCILMAAPIFYLVAALVGLLAAWAERRAEDGKSKHTALTLWVLPLLLMSLEGVVPGWSFSRDEEIVVSRVLEATPSEIEEALARVPRFDGPLPFYLRLGFPRPVRSEGAGLDVGATRRIHFAGGEGKPGDLVLEVTARGPRSVHFRCVSDGSHVAHWLEWKDTEVAWEPVDGNRTRVTWTLRYRRLLDPAWYFGPVERYGVGLAGEVLISDLATPKKDR